MTYTVTITYNGGTYNYPAGPALPGMTVRFTPTSIIFQWGTSTLAASQGVEVTNLSSYTADIFQDGTKIKTYPVTNHWWFARWRHEISAPTIVNTAKQLTDNDLLPPWAVLPGCPMPTDPAFVYTGPMSSGGVYQPMGSTGERSDIGTFHEGSGFWMLGGAPDSMLAYAEGLNTIPIYTFDERTGCFWDKIQYPLTSLYPNQIPGSDSPYWINPGPPGAANEPGWEWAHHPEAAYVAFLATEEPYHLETLQATATMLFMWSVFHYYGNEAYATIGEGQTRGTAHSLRTLGLVLIATKYYEDKFGAVPAPLKSYSYWKQIANNQLDHITKIWMNSPVAQTFRAFPAVAAFAPWQQDHLLNGLSLLAWKNPEWRPLYIWAFGNLYGRAFNLPAYPGPYQLRLGLNFIDGQSPDPSTITVDQFYPDWPTAIKANLDLSDVPGGFYNLAQNMAQALKADPTNGGNWMEANTYDMFIARNALALGVWLDRTGVVDLHTPYPHLETVYAQQDAYARKYFPRSAQPARQSAYVTPSTSTGGITLPTSATINVNQTIHLGLQVDGSLSSGPTYSTSDATIGTITPDPNPLTGVSVKGLKSGTVTITATAQGVSTLSATCTVTVSPLATTMSLVPGAITNPA